MRIIFALFLFTALPASAQNLFSISFGAKQDSSTEMSKSRASENKLAFEDLSGVCDAEKLPEGTVPIRQNSERSSAGVSMDCDIRYLVTAKNSKAPAMSEAEMNQCAKMEFEAKQHEMGTNEPYPEDRFKAEEVNQKYRPLIEARIHRLKSAQQFCLDTGKPNLMHYDFNSHRTPLEMPYFEYLGGFADGDKIPATYKGKKTYATPVFGLQALNDFGKNEDVRFNSDNLGLVKFSEDVSKMLESGRGELTGSFVYFTVTPLNAEIPFLIYGNSFDHLRRAYLLNASKTRLEVSYKDNDGNVHALISNDIIKAKQ